MSAIDPTLEADHGLSDMADDVRDRVRELIGSRLQGDIRNLDVQTLSTKKLRQDLQYAEQYGATERARKLFLLHAEPEDVHFECEYDFGRWTDTLLLAYLTDRDAFCHDQAEAYWADHPVCGRAHRHHGGRSDEGDGRLSQEQLSLFFIRRQSFPFSLFHIYPSKTLRTSTLFLFA